MTITLAQKTKLVIPPSIQLQAGIKAGDRLLFQAFPRIITITASEPTYKPTKSEWAAIRRGEAEIASGEYVTLTELLHGMDRNRRKSGKKTTRKASR